MPRIFEEPREPSGHLVRELHGLTLQALLEYLVAHVGWEDLARRIPVNCFVRDPSVKSALTFLRRTPWARQKVEEFYIEVRSSELLDAPSETLP